MLLAAACLCLSNLPPLAYKATGSSVADNFGDLVGDRLGISVAVGDTLSAASAVGGQYVRVYGADGTNLYQKDITIGGGQWASLALSGDLLVVGNCKDEGTDYGAAYVLRAENGTTLSKLVQADGASNDYYGDRVAIDAAADTIVVVGCSDDDVGTQSGSIYVYDASPPFALRFKLANPGEDGDGAGDNFGSSIGVSADAIVAGSYQDDEGDVEAGAVYVLELLDGQVRHKLLGEAANDYFGVAVAIHGTTLVVGATRDGASHGNKLGTAYVFNTISGAKLKTLADGAAMASARL